MTTRFLLVRHATCAQTHSVLLGRAIDAPLDDDGCRQARAVADRLAGEHPNLLQTSPRLRTRQTAVAIAATTGCSPLVCDLLDEVDFGRWSGQSFAMLEHDPEWRRWNAHRATASTPAGASMTAVQQVVLAHLAELARRCPRQTVVLVTHAEIIRAVLLHARGISLDDFHRVDVAPASVTAVRMDTDAPCIEAITGRAVA